jgi:hypothetical protein
MKGLSITTNELLADKDNFFTWFFLNNHTRDILVAAYLSPSMLTILQGKF